MHWMIGIDLRNLSGGAIAFARWLSTHEEAKHRFCGTHVLAAPPEPVLLEIGNKLRDEAVERAAKAALGPLEGDPLFASLDAIRASSAEEGLEAAAGEQGCHAMIIGRRKPKAEDVIVRLGRVARRMLRNLSHPTVVVPPDLVASDIPDGPVLLGTDLSEASTGAAHFARDVAKELGKDLLVTHALHVSDHYGVYLGADDWDEVVGSAARRGQDELTEWMNAHGLEGRSSVVSGSPASKLIEVAKVSGACMIVVGSRGLKAVERMFISSVGSEIASAAPVPVAVVPSAASTAE